MAGQVRDRERERPNTEENIPPARFARFSVSCGLFGSKLKKMKHKNCNKKSKTNGWRNFSSVYRSERETSDQSVSQFVCLSLCLFQRWGSGAGCGRGPLLKVFLTISYLALIQPFFKEISLKQSI